MCDFSDSQNSVVLRLFVDNPEVSAAAYYMLTRAGAF